jgi:hypothetical protein
MNPRLLVAASLLAFGLPAAASAVEGLRLTYDAAEAPVTLQRDNAGTVQVEGLPYPGLVLYRPDTGVVYYQHPDLPAWLAVAPDTVQTVSATLIRGAAWQPWQGQPTTAYQTKAGPNDCGPLYASPDAAAQSGLTLTDIWRVLSALAWLNAGSASPPCDRLMVTRPEKGDAVGLPVRFEGPNGTWQLTELVRAGVAHIELPAAAEPADDATRLNLLLRQFTPDERQGFIRQYGTLPVARQLDLLEKALANSSAEP